MSFDITGKLIAKLPLLSGVSKTGNNWQKQEFVIETLDQYPKKICTNLWGDRIDQLNAFRIGDIVTISFDLESREFNGRWYTDVKSWRVVPAGSVPQPAVTQQAVCPAAPSPVPEYGGAPAVAAPASAPATAPGIPPADSLPDNSDDNGSLPDSDTTDDLPF